MTKSLIIAEKPSVARDIVQAMGGFERMDGLPQGVSAWESPLFICTHALGHLLELYEPEDYDPKFKKWDLRDLPFIPDGFLLKPKSATAPLLRFLRMQISRSDVIEIINACDAAREGELIFREIMQHSICDKASSRVWLQSLTSEAIRHAFKNRQPSVEFQGLASAAHGRSQADWLIGMNLSRAATLKFARASEGGVWSIGRVQTPTLALLVDREFAILSHKAKPYYKIKAKFKSGEGQYDGTWFDPNIGGTSGDYDAKNDRLFQFEDAKAIIDRLSTISTGSARDEVKTREQRAPMLFSLTSLQKFMANKFQWSAKKTLDIAQKCYETHKILTYPRTESDALPRDYQDSIQKIIESLSRLDGYGAIAKTLLENTWSNVDSVFNDDAIGDHFAIIPTGRFPDALPSEEGLLFDAVIRRLLASLMPAAVVEIVNRTTTLNSEVFQSGPIETIREMGWKIAHPSPAKRTPRDSNEPKKLPALPANGHVTLQSIEVATNSTRPPPRISEGQLLSLMEHAGEHIDDPDLARVLRASGGLGTAATRADIIENLKAKDYVYKSLQPTVKGIHLIRAMKLAGVNQLISAKLTAELEGLLGLVEKNSKTREAFISATRETVQLGLNALMSFDVIDTFQFSPALGTCPKCGATVHERMWNYSCVSNKSDTAQCGFIIPKDCDGRWLDPHTVTALLSKAEPHIVDGFPDDGSKGSVRQRQLQILNGKLEIRSANGLALAEESYLDKQGSSLKRRVTWGHCPIHAADECLIVETKKAFICETKLRHLRTGQMQGTGVQLPKIICEKRLRLEDIRGFLHDGRTKLINGFKSRGGKDFDAVVYRTPAGSWAFDFRSR